MTLTIEEMIYEIVKVKYEKGLQPTAVYFHWTGGDYDATFDDYHVCVDGAGRIHYTRDLSETPAATYRRNTGSIAVALSCAKGALCYGDRTYSLGTCPPTEPQLNTAAILGAWMSVLFDLPVDMSHFMTHAEAADNLDGRYFHEPYGPSHGAERWDLLSLHEGAPWMSGGADMRGNILWYRHRLFPESSS